MSDPIGNYWGSSYDPQTGSGIEPWWSYAKDLDMPDIGKLPAYAYSKLPLPGSDLAAGAAGNWQQPDFLRGSQTPGAYVPYTNTERDRQAPTPQQDDIRSQEQLGPVINAALAVAPAFGQGIRGLGSAAEGLANIPVQSYRRKQVGEAIPQLGELFSELGNPVTNLWRGAKDIAGNWTPQANEIPAMADMSGIPEGVPGVLRSIQSGVDRLKGSWNVEIPYLAKDQYPQVLMTKDADNQLLGKIAEAIGQRPGTVSDRSRGFYVPVGDQNKNYLADIIALRKEAATPEVGTLAHETGHLAARRITGYPTYQNAPEGLVSQARTAVSDPLNYQDYLSAVTSENPEYAAWLQKTPAYSSLSPERMGDELWTRNNAGQFDKWRDAVPWNDPAPELSGRLSEFLNTLIHPSMRR